MTWWLNNAILYKKFGWPLIWYLQGFLEPISHGCWGVRGDYSLLSSSRHPGYPYVAVVNFWESRVIKVSWGLGLEMAQASENVSLDSSGGRDSTSWSEERPSHMAEEAWLQGRNNCGRFCKPSTTCCYCSVIQLCLTLFDPMDCSRPSLLVHGISQARIPEWVAISLSKDLPDPGIEPMPPALAGEFFTTEPSGKPQSSLTLAQ